MPHYYVESDGEVYLILEDGFWRFPAHLESLPFEVDQLHTMRVMGEEVRFCRPKLSFHPHWCHKDEVMSWDNVSPLVLQAINLSLPRVVTEGVIVESGKVLLVKGSRGFNKGRWTLPGGFVGYGESPETAVVREVQEEVGVPSKVLQLLDIESFIGKESDFHWHMCFYELALLSHDFSPPPDEIEAVQWFPIEDALKAIQLKKLKALLQSFLP